MSAGPARLLIALVKLYQRTLSRVIRLFWGDVCRFEPSCSRYAIACLEEHGALRGSLLSIARVCKCHPFHPGGHDPPPSLTGKSTAPRTCPAGSLTLSRERGAPPRLFALRSEKNPGRGAS
jgi:putative membrane protein insertion efficiency factor